MVWARGRRQDQAWRRARAPGGSQLVLTDRATKQTTTDQVRQKIAPRLVSLLWRHTAHLSSANRPQNHQNAGFGTGHDTSQAGNVGGGGLECGQLVKSGGRGRCARGVAPVGSSQPNATVSGQAVASTRR